MKQSVENECEVGKEEGLSTFFFFSFLFLKGYYY